MKKRLKSIAVLVSGGLDSAILLNQLLTRHQAVYPIYVQGGNIWEKTELIYLRSFLRFIKCKQLEPLATLSFPLKDIYQNLWSLTGRKVPGGKSRDEAVYLPGRNLILIAKTAIFCAQKRIPKIALAPLKSNPFPDATREFFNHYELTLSKGLDFQIKIQTPFLSKTKKDVMRLGAKLPFHLTFSCINPTRRKHCGHCNKCAERKVAFKLIHLKDPSKYA